MSRPDVSVIIPVFERPELLPLVFDALRQQDFKGTLELLVCDDGSRADYRTLLEHESRQGTDVRYVWQPHRGRGAARSRNNGIACARGELLIFLDGDSLVQPNFVSTHAATHSSDKILYCGSRKQVFVGPTDLANVSAAPVHERAERLERLPHVCMRAWQEEVHPRAPWRICMACNVGVLRAAGVVFDEAFLGWGSEDAEFACRLYSRHDYAISINPVSHVYSIEVGCEADFSRVRPRAHEDIVLCIKDMLRVCALYPDVDTDPLLLMCQYFDVDPATNRWYQLPEDMAQQRTVDEALAKASAWLLEFSP